VTFADLAAGESIFLDANSGKKPKPLIYGFLHSEPSGVIAIDQTGGRKVKATRLYVYPDVETETLYLLTLGDKSTQDDDIQDCRRFVKQIKADPHRGSKGDENDEHDDGEESDGQEKDE
jgi:hypothetical protein